MARCEFDAPRLRRERPLTDRLSAHTQKKAGESPAFFLPSAQLGRRCQLHNAELRVPRFGALVNQVQLPQAGDYRIDEQK